MNMPAAFAAVALGFSDAMGGPYVAARILSRGGPSFDAGGSVVPYTGTPSERDCRVQVDACSEAMRAADGYTTKDQRILVLSSTLDGTITSDDRVEVLTGPFAGKWTIQSVDADPAGLGWVLRGRRA